MPTCPRRRHVLVGLLLVATSALSGGPGAWAVAAVVPHSLTGTATGVPGALVTGAGQLGVVGDTDVSVAVARTSGGNAKVVAGPDSSMPAIAFPPYVKSGTYPRAVVSLTPTSGDALSPADADFEYGAVFRIDATSASRSVDNGDNLFQRGLYEEPSQFKLQLDDHIPSCLVRGSGGQAFVSSGTKVSTDVWYRATCSRVGTAVSVEVAPYDGSAPATSAVVHATTGTLDFPATEPASLGGKVTPTGALVTSATDQFNGAVSTFWVDRLNADPVPNQEPTAHASAACTALTCSFSGADSTDPDGDPITYSWDYADGGQGGSGVTTTHDYADAGPRTVTLTVADDHGHVVTDLVDVSPELSPPQDPPDPPVDQAPDAHASVTCNQLTCSFQGGGSTDPELEALTYAWDFGDGTPGGTGVSATHTYAAAGQRNVVLTVADDHGNTDTDTAVATATAPPPALTFVGSASTNGNRAKHTVSVPKSVRAGDLLVLMFAANTTTPTFTGPTGWTLLQNLRGDGTAGKAYTKVASAGDAGATVTITSSAYAKSDVTVAAYRGTGSRTAVTASAAKADNTSTAVHVSPAVTATSAGMWLVSYWADESSATTAWTGPTGQSVRSTSAGTSSGHVSALLADSGGALAAGPTGSKTARANSTSARAVSFSLLLAATP